MPTSTTCSDPTFIPETQSQSDHKLQLETDPKEYASKSASEIMSGAKPSPKHSAEAGNTAGAPALKKSRTEENIDRNTVPRAGSPIKKGVDESLTISQLQDLVTGAKTRLTRTWQEHYNILTKTAEVDDAQARGIRVAEDIARRYEAVDEELASIKQQRMAESAVLKAVDPALGPSLMRANSELCKGHVPPCVSTRWFLAAIGSTRELLEPAKSSERNGEAERAQAKSRVIEHQAEVARWEQRLNNATTTKGAAQQEPTPQSSPTTK